METIGNSPTNLLYTQVRDTSDINEVYIPEPEDDNSHITLLCRQVSPGSLVLDMGCGSGRIGVYLNDILNCKIWGADKDLSAIQKSHAFKKYEGVFCIDFDNPQISPDYNAFLEVASRADYIILSDVIEHVSDPSALMIMVSGLIRVSGKLLVSLPNMCNADIIANLLCGRFNYSPFGLLDRTHLHFFTRSSFLEWVDQMNKAGVCNFNALFIGGTKYYSKWLYGILESHPKLHNYLALIQDMFYFQLLFQLEKTIDNVNIIDKKVPYDEPIDLLENILCDSLADERDSIENSTVKTCVYNRLSNQLVDQETRIGKLQAENADLLTRNEELNVCLEGYINHRKELEAVNTSLEGQVNKLTEQVNRLQSECEQLSAEVLSSKNECINLTNEYQKLEQRLEEENAVHMQQYNDLCSIKERQEAEIKRISSLLVEREKELDGIHSSWAWKIMRHFISKPNNSKN